MRKIVFIFGLVMLTLSVYANPNGLETAPKQENYVEVASNSSAFPDGILIVGPTNCKVNYWLYTYQLYWRGMPLPFDQDVHYEWTCMMGGMDYIPNPHGLSTAADMYYQAPGVYTMSVRMSKIENGKRVYSDIISLRVNVTY